MTPLSCHIANATPSRERQSRRVQWGVVIAAEFVLLCLIVAGAL